MAEETFWLVQYRSAGGWRFLVNTLSEHRGIAIHRYGMTDWVAREKDGEVRCIKVKVVPAERSEIPQSGGG